ncbi:MAG: oxidoreductase [Geodermatophilaceae bacterium]|nr:oxidoreductase [Geodermatophilaceae bacterium]
MRLLVLGGTAWLGRCIASTALEHGHRVTCLARGSSGSVPDGAALVRADRDQPDALSAITGEHWDMVVDVSRQPGQVRRAAEALTDRSELFVFVSSANVYAEHATPGEDEDAALFPALDGDVMESMETYGPAKVACEQHVLTAFGPERCLVVRAGLIGGPGDIFGRTGYWPLRFAQPAAADGSVLVPDVPECATQVLDVRDLATWIVATGSSDRRGIFNATGETVPLPAHLTMARDVAGHTGPLVGASQDWLLGQGVSAWMGERSLPLWLPMPEYAGFSSRDGSRARAAGLINRPLRETLTDTLAWELAVATAGARRAGLSDDDERALLRAFAAT